MIKLPTRVGLAGHYTLYKGKAGGPRQKVAEFDNLITDLGFEEWVAAFGRAQAALLGTYIAIGTGTTSPQVTDTTLASWSRATNVFITGPSDQAVPGNPAYRASFLARRFNAGTLSGNYTELGVSSGNLSSSPIRSRALIVDGAGNPTSITVLSDEYLDVVYEMRAYRVCEDTVGTLTVNAVNYNYVARPASYGYPPTSSGAVEVSGYITATLGACSGNISGSVVSLGSAFATRAGNTWTATISGAIGAGTPGISGLRLSVAGVGWATQVVFDAQIPVSNSQRVTVTAAWELSRYTP